MTAWQENVSILTYFLIQKLHNFCLRTDMTNVITTIIPIFTIVVLGWFARSKGFMPSEFLGPANRLVYYLAIPAMVFRSISKGSLTIQFNFEVIAITLSAVMIIFATAWGAGLIARVERRRLATFVQSSFHGNLGYIGLAVAYYYLGNEGLVRASIIAGFVMILQNLLAVFVLQLYADGPRVSRHRLFLKILGNPVIISAIAGILFSLTEAKTPLVIGRSLDILSSLALPMALLLIGASLSFELVRLRMCSILFVSLLKLMILPGVGFALYQLFVPAPQDYLPGLILLTSPTATITFVMAKEMDGDADFAVAAISVSTILSALTFSLWLQ